MKRFLSLLTVISMLAILSVSVPAQVPEADPSIKVHDYADLLTDEEEQVLQEKALSILEDYQMDIAVITTDDPGGLSAMEYADDFFDYNGYGYGEEDSGLLMVINMQDREIWISTHEEGRLLFLDADIDRILDVVYDYLVDGDYYGGCLAFLNQAESHIPSARIRYSDRLPTENPGAKTQSAKVYDQAGILTADQITELSDLAEEVVTRRQMDLIILTTLNSDGKTSRAYAEDFYNANRFGYGSNRDGLLLLFNLQDREIWFGTYNLGNRIYNSSDVESMLDAVYSYADRGEYYQSMRQFIQRADSDIPRLIERMEQEAWENLPLRQKYSVGYIAGVTFLIALIPAGIIILILVAAHGKKLAQAPTAQSYMARDGFQLYRQKDEFLHSHLSKRPIPQNNGGGGGGGGGSGGGGRSFSGGGSSHSSSSGRSHGGGGRSF